MSKHKTKIGWTHQDGFIGETWNPVTGCTPISPGCDNCYAQAMLGRKLPGHSGKGVVCHHDRLDIIKTWKMPRCVFLCSMGDLFHEEVGNQFIALVWLTMARCPQHRFLVLTKRATRMRSLVNDLRSWCYGGSDISLWKGHTWPLPNVALGVSVENQEMADERIPLLLDTPAAMRFVSVEPMIEPVHFEPKWLSWQSKPRVDWAICGGETGAGCRTMKAEWAFDLKKQCWLAGQWCRVGLDEDGGYEDRTVPFYFKQMSKKAAIPVGLQIRQFPVWPPATDAGEEA